MHETNFICPVCGLRLRTQGQTLACELGHTYDRAREGYVNLITGAAPRGMAGDSSQMVQARKAFLERGHYLRLAQAVAVAARVNTPGVVAEFGCGEGYYLGQVQARERYGTDISKPAVAAAAKAYPEVSFAVADTNKFIPLADAGVDVGLCIFAPRNEREFSRVIAPGGKLIVVIPGPGHLKDVRERFGLMGIEPDKAAKVAAQLDEFTLRASEHLDYDVTLDPADLRNLIAMTPNARHMDEAKRNAIAGTAAMVVTLAFEILEFTRRESGLSA